MSRSGDVATTLAQGMPAVDTLAEYVWAAHQLGYQHPDLTTQPAAMYDRYCAEEGLDLGALEADRAALTAAAAVAEQASQLQREQADALTAAWQGGGAAASHTFLTGHATASEQLVTALRAAADALGTLGDRLWRAVDDKVSAAIEIEQRCASHRDVWLAAARTVRSGVGQRDTAAELVDQQVRPFLAEHVGGDWLTAMRAGTAAVADAYEDALSAIRAAPLPVFAVPGQLGPTSGGRLDTAGVPSYYPPAQTVWAVPASAPAYAAPAAAPASVSAPAPAPAAMPAPAVAPAAGDPAAAIDPAVTGASAPMPPTGSGTGGWGAGLPGAGSSGVGSPLADLGQRLADMFGGLIGSDGSTLGGDSVDPFDAEDPLADEGEEVSEESDLDEDPEDEAGDETDEETDEEAPGEPGENPDGEEETVPLDGAAELGVDDAATEDVVEQPEAQPNSQPAPPVETPTDPTAPPTEPLADSTKDTPCSIAADELPQVGG